MDKQHAVINYEASSDEHKVKDLGSLNGVSTFKHAKQRDMRRLQSSWRQEVGQVEEKRTERKEGREKGHLMDHIQGQIRETTDENQNRLGKIDPEGGKEAIKEQQTG